MAWASFPLREDVANAFDGDADSALEVAEDVAELKILTDTLALRFDKDTGASTISLRDGRPLVTGGPMFNVWRAPTDNDANTWGDQRAAIHWREVGLDSLQEQVDGVLLMAGAGPLAEVEVRAASVSELDEDAIGEARWQGLLSRMGRLAGGSLNEEQLQSICDLIGMDYRQTSRASKLRRR